jgi:hypothetical protein
MDFNFVVASTLIKLNYAMHLYLQQSILVLNLLPYFRLYLFNDLISASYNDSIHL